MSQFGWFAPPGSRAKRSELYAWMRRLYAIVAPCMVVVILVAALTGPVSKGVSIVIYGCAAILLIAFVELNLFIRWERSKERQAGQR